jgi:hypothetical protein
VIPCSFIVAALSGVRIDLADERGAWGKIKSILSDRLPSVDITLEREDMAGGISGLLVDGRVAVALKLGHMSETAFQDLLLLRAGDARVAAVVALCAAPLELPAEIGGKPLRRARLGAAA